MIYNFIEPIYSFKTSRKNWGGGGLPHTPLSYVSQLKKKCLKNNRINQFELHKSNLSIICTYLHILKQLINVAHFDLSKRKLVFKNSVFHVSRILTHKTAVLLCVIFVQ